MTDLTILHASNSLYPLTHGLFSKSTPRFIVQQQHSAPVHIRHHDADELVQDQTKNTSRGRRSRPEYDTSFLSPPVNTWKSPNRQRRHRPTRSQSAPPGPDRRPKLEATPEAAVENNIIALEALKPPSSCPLQSKSFSTFGSIGTTRGGELLPPPPPLRAFSFLIKH